MSIQSEIHRFEVAMRRIETLELQVEAHLRAIDQGHRVWYGGARTKESAGRTPKRRAERYK